MKNAVRTTIELTDPVRARLLAIAARRGLKGFSGIVQAAVETYLDDLDSENERMRRAVLLKGSFREKDTDNMRNALRAFRGRQ